MSANDASLALLMLGLVLTAASPAALAADPSVDGVRCATPEVRELLRTRGATDPEAYRRLLQERWDFPDSLETEHVLILHALDKNDPDHVDADYVHRLAAYLEGAWHSYRSDPRFDMPEAVGTGPPGAAGHPLLLVRVMKLDDAGGYARAESPVPGLCPHSYSGSVRIDSRLPDTFLRATAAHELWHVFTYAIDPTQSSWVEESTARWAEWQLWPEHRNLIGTREFLQHPYDPLWSEWPQLRTYGGVLFWTFLQDRLGDPLVVQTWKGMCDEAWLSALRDAILERHGLDLDELLVEFWQWNYRTLYADDGRHYRNGRGYPLLGIQAVETTYGPQPRALPDNLVARQAATNAILFTGRATRENLRITFDGAPELAPFRVVSVVGTTWPNTHSLEMVRRPDVQGDCVFEISGWNRYDQVALLMTNYVSTPEDKRWFGFGWIAEEFGPPAFDVAWRLNLAEPARRRLASAPSPFSTSTQIRYRAASGDPTWLDVYDVAGNRIRALVRGLQSPIGGDYQEVWDGTDDRGRSVPSGTYFLQLRTSSGTETRRIVRVR